jgi:hypothetical protein
MVNVSIEIRSKNPANYKFLTARQFENAGRINSG